MAWCLTRAFAILAAVGVSAAPSLAQPVSVSQSVNASIAHLKTAMDEFHTRIPVSEDVSSAGNRFHTYAKIPNQSAPVSIYGAWTTNPRRGATAVRNEFLASSPTAFGGFYFLTGLLQGTATAPVPNFGTVPNAGVDLTGATRLTFWARGNAGGEQIEFFVAGVGRDALSGMATQPFPDSSPRRPAVGSLTTLTSAWQQYSIDLTGMDLSYVLGGFGWVASAVANPAGAVFFLDDLEFELSPTRAAARLNEPRFVRSYVTLPLQPNPFDANTQDDIDFVFRNTAFTYDNALTLLAFLADGGADGIRRARLIGDAFVYAVEHDRFFNDNRACGSTLPIDDINGARLRTAYAAGDIALPNGWAPNGRVGTSPVPGFYLDVSQAFYEVEQNAIDVGNNAWAAIALLSLYERTRAPAYLDVACKLGQFVQTFQATAGLFQGFLGGVENPQSSSPTRRPYASTEHNLDVAVLMTRLARLTGEARWTPMATHAETFVEAMWDASRGCYLTGTKDSSTLNTDALPLDAQAWSLQALLGTHARHPQVLACADSSHATTVDGVTGFDFNDDRDGVWLEGTGQMAVAYVLAGRALDGHLVRTELRRVQALPDFGGQGGLVAASRDSLTTGFQFRYFKRVHIAATAWNVFAQLGVNPFQDTGPAVPRAPASFRAGLTGNLVTLSWVPSPGAASYVLEAGSRPGLADLFVGDIGDVESFATPAPAGTYYVRVRAANDLGVGPASGEVVVQIGGCPLPAPPTGLVTAVAGAAASLRWNASPGATSYALEVGSLPGQADIFRGNVGSSTSASGTVPSALYFARVRAVNSCGVSPTSEEIDFVVACPTLAAPASLTATAQGSNVTLAWTPVVGATSYQLEAGFAPSVTNVLITNVGSTASLGGGGVPPGSYRVRVRAVASCGVGPASPVASLTVP